MPGLIGDAEGGENTATSGGNTAFSPPAASGQSHLDSFFQGSGWTREDVMLLAVLVQAVLLVAWYAEVRNA